MRNRQWQQIRLRNVLPVLQPGLYLLDTELNEREIEDVVNEYGRWTFFKEELLPSRGGSPFEMFVIALCWKFNCKELDELKTYILCTCGQQKENIIYEVLIRVVRIISKKQPSVLLLYGEHDLTSFKHEELAKLNYAVKHHEIATIILSMRKDKKYEMSDDFVKHIKLYDNLDMEDRLHMVHITYKHDEAHKPGIDAILGGLNAHKIPYSIDYYDIFYRDNIQEYEKEIGASDIVIMFIISEYFMSLDCMYEMTQLFKNGSIYKRVFPVVDMGNIPRDGDGLTQVKSYWNEEKNRKADLIKNEPGDSSFILTEISKIDNILIALNDFWEYIVHTNTGSYESIIADNAEILVTEIEKQLNINNVVEISKFIPTTVTAPEKVKRFIQQGDRTVYVEHNSGTITIN